MPGKRKKFTENSNLILLAQVDSICPLCPKPLIYEKNGKNYKQFEIAHIYPLNATKEEKELLKDEEKLSEDLNDLNNLICLCVGCHTKYDKPRTIQEYRNLVEIKKQKLKEHKSKLLWETSNLEKEISEIIQVLSNHDFNSSTDDILNYNPKTIDDKVNNTITLLTKRKIHRNVQDYYIIVKNKFIEFDKTHPTTTEIISSQIKLHYLHLYKQSDDKDQKEIFDQLVKWISKKADLKNSDAAEILISYFVQNCEVF
ncbi:HNH endonuclease [Flavobacterium sp. D11R37]|uniref:ABC-three component system protein n=1 Tax=Flavobacterium coralii TaxID=2838017 RepID=UPI001CA6D1CD|nr:ABC-three component system protein [Flavobacterium coralii]MBY8963340.1 HNH endonuclease [Flavobacterium coralii]